MKPLITNPFTNRPPTQRLTGLALLAVSILILASCSALTDVGQKPPAEDQLQSEQAEQGEAVSDSAVEAPTTTEVQGSLDGSGEAEPVGSDVWSAVGQDSFPAPKPSTSVAELVNTGGQTVIAGGIYDHNAGDYAATIWTMTGTDPTTVTSLSLPTLAPVASEALTITEVEGSTGQGGPTLAAAGYVGEKSNQRAAVWVGDGTNWEQIQSEAFRSTREEHAQWIVSGPDGSVLAIGETRAAEKEFTPALWFSPDGRDWKRLDTSTFAADGDSELTVEGGLIDSNLIVLVGNETTTSTKGVVWLSQDQGETFEKLTPAAFDRSDVTVDSVAKAPDGSYVVVGSDKQDGAENPASWTSSDGRTWNGPYEFEPDTFDQRNSSFGYGAEGVTQTADGLLARSAAEALSQVWFSDNGQEWQIIGTMWEQWPAGREMNDFVAVDDQVIALSNDDYLLYHDPAKGWSEVSLSGNETRSLEPQPWIEDLAAVDNDIVAVGGQVESPSGDSIAAAWRLTTGVLEPATINSDGIKLSPITDIEPVPSPSDSLIDGQAMALAPDVWQSNIKSEGWGATHILGYNNGTFDWAEKLSSNNGGRVYVDNLAVSGDNSYAAGTNFAAAFFGSELDPDFTSAPVSDSPEYQRILLLCARRSTALAITATETETGGASLMPYTKIGREPWKAASDPAPSFSEGRSAEAHGCVNGPTGFFVVGEVTNEDDSTDGKIWFSELGQEWEELDLPDSMAGPDTSELLYDIASFDNHLVVIGKQDTIGDDIATIWVETDGEWTETPIGDDAANFSGYDLAIAGDGTVLVSGYRSGFTHLYTANFSALTGEDR